MSILNVLIACEESQAECREFRRLGHNAFSCDVQPCLRSGNPSWHIQGDVTPFLMGATSFYTQDGTFHTIANWQLIIAHPPCTFFSKLSATALLTNPDLFVSMGNEIKYVNSKRFYQMLKARSFFFQCLNAAAPYVAVENPIPMKIADLPKPTTFACPSWFGDRYTKKTLYWLKNLPPLMATVVYPGATSLTTHRSGKYRSRTSSYLAHAIAEQWSQFIISQI